MTNTEGGKRMSAAMASTGRAVAESSKVKLFSTTLLSLKLVIDFAMNYINKWE